MTYKITDGAEALALGLSKMIVDDKGKVARWYTHKQLRHGTPLSSREVARALWDIERAEGRGFFGCRAVFVDFRYEGLDEAVSVASQEAGGGWGRGQDVTYRNTVGADGKTLVPDPDYPVAPPEWRGEYCGYPCEVRANWQGARCGYVTVPAGHPVHGKSLQGCDEGDPELRVHGGVTYSHLTDSGGWCVGFDCSHAWDRPHPEYEHGDDYRAMFCDGVYRSLDFVLGEIASLAEQLKALEAVAAA